MDFVTESGSRAIPVDRVVDERLANLQEHVGGYDYATVTKAYWRGSGDGDEVLKTAALRWLRDEYSTKTEARQAIGVRNIIDDGDVHAFATNGPIDLSGPSLALIEARFSLKLP